MAAGTGCLLCGPCCLGRSPPKLPPQPRKFLRCHRPRPNHASRTRHHARTSVRSGEERRNGFATYDSYRQSWWCTTSPKPYGAVDDNPSYPYNRSATAPPAKPLFITPVDTAEAAPEVAALEKIPSASQYFATEALSWWKLHPTDPRTPDLLGQADRVLRNSCRTELPYDLKTYKPVGDSNNPMLTTNLAHAIFDALHKDYPQSSWAKRYKSWE